MFKRYFLKRALPDADGNAFDFASEVEGNSCVINQDG